MLTPGCYILVLNRDALSMYLSTFDKDRRECSGPWTMGDFRDFKRVFFCLDRVIQEQPEILYSEDGDAGFFRRL